ncbi:hypothetical protein [uncultured Xanthomonas sp.]|uniref:hypothetical protein n=1 Tax=uncultured Xanthomonas sp. TaxID=152831 RepID=UPI0025E7B934|nr:hypothetical protein [uncultured Xanthomonas sp.]
MKMRFYQVQVEGNFVHAPVLEGKLGGFQTTFFLSANNAKNAIHKVRTMLVDRMDRNSVFREDHGFFKSYFWVNDIWEINENKMLEKHGDSGFTFFRINFYEFLSLSIRRFYLVKVKPWLLIAG